MKVGLFSVSNGELDTILAKTESNKVVYKDLINFLLDSLKDKKYFSNECFKYLFKEAIKKNINDNRENVLKFIDNGLQMLLEKNITDTISEFIKKNSDKFKEKCYADAITYVVINDIKEGKYNINDVTEEFEKYYSLFS